MPSLCSKCAICACSGFCLAGNGDDDFSLASKDEIFLRLRDLINGIPQKYGTSESYAEKSINEILNYIGITRDTANKTFLSNRKSPCSELYKSEKRKYDFRKKYGIIFIPGYDYTE